MLKKIVKKTLGLSGNDGLAIFDFSKDNRTELRSKNIGCSQQHPT